MYRFLALLTAVAAPAALQAQSLPSTSVPLLVASAEPSPAPFLKDVAPALPEAPSAVFSSSLAAEDSFGDQAGVAAGKGTPNTAVAPKYSGIILPGQTTERLSAGNKIVYGFKDAFSPFSLVGVTVSAGYSHLVDSAPHYGTNAEAFGKREGVAALRNVEQALFTDAVFAPIFHDDPRYYELGRQHKFLSRVIYAGTRVVITRTDSGRNTINAPLLLGYGATAGMNNLYYPDRDTGAKSTLQSWATSVGGAALGMEVNEFLDDALRIVHLRK